jgi:Na+-translocating ferredoxin:NAD+ oxidoreductase RnfD subunit/Pyruvate/2-oxoacid:ferredoxin oxidoreductase delta subunit
MSKPKEYSWMTKNKLMTYTFFALLILTIITAALWSQETTPSKWNLGLTLAINAIISVGIAVGLDAFLNKITADSPLNLMSAAVFGLIVTDCYVLGVPIMGNTPGIELFPLEAPQCFIFVAGMSVIGLIVFKKLIGLAGRKYVNPAAAAKIVVMVPFIQSLLLAIDHMKSGLLKVPSLAGPIGLTNVVNGTGGGTGYPGFGAYMWSCFSNSNIKNLPTVNMNTLLQQMLLDKFHGWPGGASTIAVLVVGIAFFVVARRYVKWRITISYLVAVAVLSVIFSAAYGDPGSSGYLVRLLFLMFIGSSIFLAFFMATDPATTPLTYVGQIIFGVGTAILTVLMITYLQFFGASFVALVIMNLTVPALDKVGRLKPRTESIEPKLPRAQAFAPEKVKEYQCMRCGACMRVCCHALSPILIKQAFDKMSFDAMSKLHADYCTGCGHCSYVCPSRIDLKGAVLRSKVMLRQQE